MSPKATSTTALAVGSYVYFGLPDTAERQENAERRADERRAFLSGEKRNPRLNYPVLEDDLAASKLLDMEKKVADLLVESSDLAHDDDRERALDDIFRVRRVEIQMLQISQQLATQELSEEERTRKAYYFERANDEIYGKIEPSLFNGLVEQTLQQAQRALADKLAPDEVKDAAKYILDNVDPAPDAQIVTYPVRVDGSVLKTLRDLIMEEYADIVACIPQKPDGQTYTPEEILDVFLRIHEVRQTGWGARIQEGQRNIESNQEEEKTVIGSERRHPNKDELTYVALHEYVHTGRRASGDKTGDPLLGGTGLPGYLETEEGITTIFEECFEGKQRLPIPGDKYYLMIGWAKGMDGKGKRDFRDVFDLEFQRRIVSEHYFEGSRDKLEGQELIEDIYKSVERIFRGTPCDIPGMVYTKDLAYYRGNQTVWPIFSKIAELPAEKRRAALQALLVAKYNLTNPLHNRLVALHVDAEVLQSIIS